MTIRTKEPRQKIHMHLETLCGHCFKPISPQAQIFCGLQLAEEKSLLADVITSSNKKKKMMKKYFPNF